MKPPPVTTATTDYTIFDGPIPAPQLILCGDTITDDLRRVLATHRSNEPHVVLVDSGDRGRVEAEIREIAVDRSGMRVEVPALDLRDVLIPAGPSPNRAQRRARKSR